MTSPASPARHVGIPAQGGPADAADDATLTAVVPSGAGSNETQGWTVLRWILQDWKVNAGRPDSRVVLALFRFGQFAFRNWGFPGRLVGIVCQAISSIVFGVELPSGLRIGPRLRLYHPHTIVLNPAVRMGADCHLRQGTTIGNQMSRSGADLGSPDIGDSVDLGATCVVLGPIRIGDHARVGALAVVTKPVPAWAVIVGNPGRVIRIDEPTPP
jgi:serine acetyltransferase